MRQWGRPQHTRKHIRMRRVYFCVHSLSAKNQEQCLEMRDLGIFEIKRTLIKNICWTTFDCTQTTKESTWQTSERKRRKKKKEAYQRLSVICRWTGSSWCRKINSVTTSTDSKGERTFNIYHKLDCHSAWLVYMLKCKIDNILYVGKSDYN